MGNCGIGFAPCQADRRTFLSELMEAIEDIPTDVIQQGLEYDFETFEAPRANLTPFGPSLGHLECPNKQHIGR